MKLRFVQNSLRLRLRKSEVKKLQQTSQIDESVTFGPGQTLVYQLQSLNTTNQPEISYTDGNIVVQLPKPLVTQWANSDQVSIEYHLSVDKTDQLHLLIEKDFPCQHQEEENFEDTFFELSDFSYSNEQKA